MNKQTKVMWAIRDAGEGRIYDTRGQWILAAECEVSISTVRAAMRKMRELKVMEKNTYVGRQWLSWREVAPFLNCHMYTVINDGFYARVGGELFASTRVIHEAIADGLKWRNFRSQSTAHHFLVIVDIAYELAGLTNVAHI